MTKNDWTLVSATNNENLLKSCLLSSPDICSGTQVILQRGYRSAAEAYNAAILMAKTDLLVFAHQDVYFPAGWLNEVQNGIDVLSKIDPNWGVLGVIGRRDSGAVVGFMYDGTCKTILGNEFDGGREVKSLDEVVLILRKSSGLLFDPKIGGFHMYGTDICLEARRQRKKCYAIAAFCIHNTNEYWMLPWQFWICYLAMRRKWRSQLPIRTMCTEITHWCWPMVRWNMVRAINLVTGRDKPPNKRVENPQKLCQEVLISRSIVG
jgi:hypothetical protein